MSTVKLRLRDDFDSLDDIDLAKLTPRARELAEQLARHPLNNRRVIWYAHSNGDRTPWEGWSHYPADSTMDPHRYLEQQAGKAPAGWRLLPMRDDQSAREAHLQLLKADVERAETAFRNLVLREASEPRSEAPVAREAGIDRMTVRTWAGKPR